MEHIIKNRSKLSNYMYMNKLFHSKLIKMPLFYLVFLLFTHLSSVSTFTVPVIKITNPNLNVSYVPDIQFPCRSTKYQLYKTGTQSRYVAIQIGTNMIFQLHGTGNASNEHNQHTNVDSITCQEELQVQISNHNTEHDIIPCPLKNATCKTTHYSDYCHAIVEWETGSHVRNCTVVKLQLEFDIGLSSAINTVAVVIFVVCIWILLMVLVLVFYKIRKKQSPSDSPLPKASDSTTFLDETAVSSFSHSNLPKAMNLSLVQPPSDISKTISKSSPSPSPTSAPSSLGKDRCKLQNLKTPAREAKSCPAIYEKALQRESALATGKFSRASCSSGTSSGTGTDSSTVRSIGDLLQAARNIKVGPPVKCESTSILKTIDTDIPDGPVACMSPRAEEETQKDMKSSKISNWPIYFMKSLLRKKRRERQSRMESAINL